MRRLLRNGAVIIGGICAATLAVCGGAWAQRLGRAQRLSFEGFGGRLRATAGLHGYQQAGPDTPNANSSFSFTLSYDLLKPSRGRLADLAFYVEGGSAEADSRGGFEPYRANVRDFYGLGVEGRVKLFPTTKNFEAYGLAGGGVYSLGQSATDVYEETTYDEFGVARTITAHSTLAGHNSAARLAYRIGGGIRVGRALLIEAAYLPLGKYNGANYSGWQLEFGARL